MAYGPLAKIYDDLTNDVEYEVFADYYEATFAGRKKNVKTILDLGCGTGTLALLLAKRGFDTVAVDASEDMLMVAQEKCCELPSNCIRPLFLCQSMSEIDLYGTMDAAVSCLDAVNYIPDEEVAEMLRLLHLFIEPDGILIFDINSPERLRSLDGYTFVDEDEDKLCLWRADFDEEQNALFYGMDIFTRRGKLWQRSFEEHVEYVHEPELIIKQLEAAGFINIEIRRDGPQHELDRVFVVADNTPHEV